MEFGANHELQKEWNILPWKGVVLFSLSLNSLRTDISLIQKGSLSTLFLKCFY